jgi:hypothetical protein
LQTLTSPGLTSWPGLFLGANLKNPISLHKVRGSHFCGVICSAVYSWYVGNYLKGMSIGMLSFAMGWMTVEWFILGDDECSISTDQGSIFIEPPRLTKPGDGNAEELPSLNRTASRWSRQFRLEPKRRGCEDDP